MFSQKEEDSMEEEPKNKENSSNPGSEEDKQAVHRSKISESHSELPLNKQESVSVEPLDFKSDLFFD